MPAEAPTASNDPGKGLPSVVPPSGKFLAQLFLVPFLIVAVIVGFLLAIHWLVGGPRSPEEFLQRIDDPNPDVRWRAAEELAQVLQRDDHLAGDPKFGLDLADRLQRALQRSASESKAARDASAPAPDPQSLGPAGDEVLYVSACLASMTVPVGAPLLADMTRRDASGDARVVGRRRWGAVWNLARLGEGLRRYGEYPTDRRATILETLRNESHAGGDRGRWAQVAHDFLEHWPAGSLRPLGVDTALTQAAEDPDPFLREIAAFALNFWQGTPEEKARLDDVLVKLSYDDGHGEDLLDPYRAGARPDEEPVTRVPGLRIRYNATVALARRGSDKVRLGVLKEMLDEQQQLQNFRLKRKNGDEVADEPTAAKTVEAALGAVIDLHAKKPDRDLRDLVPAVEVLKQSPNIALRHEAERTLKALRGDPAT